MIYLIYISSAVKSFTEAELIEILNKSRKNNSELGITGILLFKDGNFLQVLEGEEASVRQLYAKISSNSQHFGATILEEGELTERQFGDWSMGFYNLNHSTTQSLPGFSPFMNKSFTAADYNSDPAGYYALLKLFRDNM
jgi:hypothetical protein